MSYEDLKEQLRVAFDELERLTMRNNQWGPIKVPESLKALYEESSDAGRDFRIICEDRRVTDLSADYWMRQSREKEKALRETAQHVTALIDAAKCVMYELDKGVKPEILAKVLQDAIDFKP